MVSLFDISLQKPLWSHISTGIPTLDSMLDLHSEALIDMQTVPSNAPLNAILCNMMASHLSRDNSSIVVMLETLGSFDWDALVSHPAYDKSWFDEKRIFRYDLSSLAKVYSFFAFKPLPPMSPGSTLLLIPKFHEVVELYRHQVTATYEEHLLQHHIEQNRHILRNKEEGGKELTLEDLPQLPKKSILLREDPYIKAQSHINELFSMMSEFVTKQSAVIILIGHLEAKYKPYTHATSQDPHSSETAIQVSQNTSMEAQSGRPKARLVLTPVSFTNHDRNNPAESKITQRLIFYYDWYFRSPHFKKSRRAVKKDDRYLVSVVKCIGMNSVKNITEPVYFDFRFLPGSSNLKSGESWFIDFSDDHQENLSTLIQHSMTSTQVYERPGTPRMSDKRRRSFESDVAHNESSQTEPSSSPTHGKKARIETSDSESEEEAYADAQEDEAVLDLASSSDESISFIEGSDVESTGTLLEDLQDDQSGWLIRHS